MNRAILLLSSCFMLLSGCGSTPTFEEMCDDIGPPLCRRVAECDPSYNYNDCITNGKLGCCVDAGVCNDEITGMDDPDDYRERCNQATEAQSCNEILSATVPAACMTGCGSFCG